MGNDNSHRVLIKYRKKEPLKKAQNNKTAKVSVSS